MLCFFVFVQARAVCLSSGPNTNNSRTGQYLFFSAYNTSEFIVLFARLDWFLNLRISSVNIYNKVNNAFRAI